jgi:anti-sigma B factor antagonist
VTISHADISGDLRLITIAGRLDIQGTEEIAQQFTVLSATAKRCVVVDLSGLNFLASIGIRALISNAKSLQKLGGRMALVVGDNTSVAKILETTGIDVLLKMFKAFPEAERFLLDGWNQ